MAISIFFVVLVPDQQKILREEQVVDVDSIVTTPRRCCAHNQSTVSCPTMCDPITTVSWYSSRHDSLGG